MSPRSEEFIAGARERLAGGRDALASGHPDLAASAAYYAMLYAARAALSERDLHAKSHAGVWTLFGEALVSEGQFDSGLAREARQAQRIRELGDYEAAPPSAEQAETLIDVAARFLGAIEQLLDAG